MLISLTVVRTGATVLVNSELISDVEEFGPYGNPRANAPNVTAAAYSEGIGASVTMKGGKCFIVEQTPADILGLSGSTAGACVALAVALTRIKEARDFAADGGRTSGSLPPTSSPAAREPLGTYPAPPDGPDEHQAFDDWAADVAEEALDSAGDQGA